MKTAAHRVLERLKESLGDFHIDLDKALAAMRPLYHDEVVFQDPLQKVVGWPEFEAMNRRLVAKSRVFRFHVGDWFADGDEGFMSWTLDVAFKRVPGSYKFDGSSHFKLRDGKIVYHRDYWDLLGSIMASLPVAPVYRRLVARLG